MAGPGRKVYIKLNPPQRRQVVNMYRDGWPMSEIAKKFKVSVSTIRRITRGIGGIDRAALAGLKVDTRVEKNQEAVNALMEDSPPAKAYVWQLYPVEDQDAYLNGTLTAERAVDLAATLPTLRALRDFAVYCDLYEATKLAPHQRAWIEHMMAHQSAAVFAPPGSGKSYLFSVFLPCWILAGGGHEPEYYHNPANPLRNGKVLLVSESEMQAKKNIRGISGRLDGENKKLTRAFGRFRSDETMWQTGQLEVAGRERYKTTGDASLVGVGVSTRFLGFRADWTICDDFASVDNCKTPQSADEIMEWMGYKVFTRSERGARQFVIMARLPIPNDPSVRIENMGKDDDEDDAPVFACMVSPAILDYPTKEMLWGEDEAEHFLTWKELTMRRKQQPSRAHFETIYNQVPFKGEASLALREWIYGEGGHPGCLDMDRILGQEVPIALHQEDRVPSVRVMSMDPSPTKYAAALVMDIPLLGRGKYAPQLIDIERSKMGPAAMIALMRDWRKKYRYRVLIFEQNAAQRWLLEDPDFQQFQRASGVKVIDHQTTGANKPDPDYGVRTLSRDIRDGNIRIPYGDAEARGNFQILIREMLEEVPTNDTIMALWFPKWALPGLNHLGHGNGWPGHGRRGGAPIAPPPRLARGASYG